MTKKKRLRKEKKLSNLKELKKDIKETFPDIKPKYSFNPFTKNHEVSFIDLNSPSLITLSILEDSTWIDIKKNIEKRIAFYKENYGLPECLICYEKITSVVGYCRMCTLIYCYDCFMKILIANSGIHICPQCRYTIDNRDTQSSPISADP